ncbi:MAG TPA: phenylalanine--tRNA ligase subunit beta, partial [Candidatus Aenigmarchaeota archaeon]|nr:phenylalanine--tRNA ligase subunit beta [Candidatus Aenigmarchaeota archaeon]
MPVITYRKEDLFELLGKKLSDKELEEAIHSFKLNVEEISEEEIEIEHTAERIDMFGIEGLARALKYYLGINKKVQKFKVSKPKVSVLVKNVPIRPYIACAVVRNVKLTDSFIRSLMNIQEVLHDTLGRKRVKVAIGIHDFDKISFPAKYEQVSPKEKMVPLGEKREMTLEEILEKTEKGKQFAHIIKDSEYWPVYSDKKGIFSFPPILNSERTRVTEKTKNLFVEITGINKEATLIALNVLVTNFAERGCKIEGVKLKYGRKIEITPKLKETARIVNLKNAEKLTGLKFSPSLAKKLFLKMGMNAKSLGKSRIKVFIPPYRSDILHEWDLIEDLVIAYGFDKIKPELPKLGTKGKLNELEEFADKFRTLMIGLGFQEVMTPVLSNPKDQFERMSLKPQEFVEIENPASELYTCLRVWLLPNLMKFLTANKHVEFPQMIFEIGDVVIVDENEETQTKNRKKLAAVISHSNANFAQIRSIIDALLKNIGISYRIEPFEHPSFIQGRVGKILVDDKEIGFFGEIHPQVLENWDLEMPTVGLEIYIDGLK